MSRFIKVESTDQRLFMFTEKHITGGQATVLITGKQIIEFMREMTANPFGMTHTGYIQEFCETYDAELILKE